nr:hypothetical protein [Tanacetum cinerariifolium]
MDRQCTQPKRTRNVAWFKEKAMLAEAHEAGQILDEEQLAFLTDLGIPDGQAIQTIISNNAAFQTEDLDAYDYDCDDDSNAKVVLMANISSYGSDVLLEVIQIVLRYLDSRCSKHMTENCSQLMNFVSKFLGTIRFINDQVAKIMGYGDYQLGNVIISRVYYVEGLGYNLFSVGKLCDADLETSPTCLLSKASKTKSWLWHCRLSHLNFGKSKKSSHQPKDEDTNKEKIYLLHMDLCGSMCMESINMRRYILVIVDDYSRFTWVRFLRSKDEAPDAIIKCIKNIKVCLNVTVRNVRTDNGTKFVNQTLRVPLFLWPEAINTACYTQNRSLIRLRYNKTPYELMHDKKPDLSFLHVFGSLCYPTNDSEDLGKLNAKADICIFVRYMPAKKAFRLYNKRTRKIMEIIHVTFDELTTMASEQFGSEPGFQVMTPATTSLGLVPNPIPQQPCNPPTMDDWDRLFQPMFDEYFNPPTIDVSPVPVAVVTTESPVSTSIDLDAPSISISSTQEQEHSSIISQGFEESSKTLHFHDDPLHESLLEDSTSHGSSLNVRPFHTLFEHLGAVDPTLFTRKAGNDLLLGKLIQKLLLNQKCMGYLVRAYFNISPTRYYKDNACWNADLKSKTTEDITSIRSFVKVLVLNQYVLVRKIL